MCRCRVVQDARERPLGDDTIGVYAEIGRAHTNDCMDAGGRATQEPLPRPWLNLTRYHGVLAPHAKLRSQVVPQPVVDQAMGGG